MSQFVKAVLYRKPSADFSIGMSSNTAPEQSPKYYAFVHSDGKASVLEYAADAEGVEALANAVRTGYVVKVIYGVVAELAAESVVAVRHDNEVAISRSPLIGETHGA